MQLILFVGLQASGKSTFYRQRFADTHLRLNLDMLRTRNREQMLFYACLASATRIVIDNTNPTPQDRARYIAPARAAGFSVVGYHFEAPIDDCKARNEARPPGQVIPVPGLLATHARLVRPAPNEGFDQLFVVRIVKEGGFSIEEVTDEV